MAGLVPARDPEKLGAGAGGVMVLPWGITQRFVVLLG